MNSNRFFIGYEYPVTENRMATIYLDGLQFGACWVIRGGLKENEGQIGFNRHTYALNLKCPVILPSDNYGSLVMKLETWLKNRWLYSKKPLSFDHDDDNEPIHLHSRVHLHHHQARRPLRPSGSFASHLSGECWRRQGGTGTEVQTVRRLRDHVGSDDYSVKV